MWKFCGCRGSEGATPLAPAPTLSALAFPRTKASTSLASVRLGSSPRGRGLGLGGCVRTRLSLLGWLCCLSRLCWLSC